MTDEEIIQEAVRRTIETLKTNGKTVGQLTPVNSYSSSDYVELNGGRRVSLTAIQEAVAAAIEGDLENLSADIAGMAIQVFTCSRTATYAIVQIKQAGHTIMTATINIATQAYAGLMSAADKEKLDGIDAASGLVAVVDIGDIDDLNTADCQLAATPTRYAVKKDTSRGTVVVALLDILSDDMRHVVTQVLTTHYVLSNGVLDTSTHMDTEVYRYYRSCKISGGTLPVEPGEWTPWQHLTPPMVALTQEAYDTLVDEGKVEEDTYYYTYE